MDSRQYNNSIPFHSLLQLGPNADIKKWEEEQIGIATVRFGAKDAKEKNKVCAVVIVSSHCQLKPSCSHPSKRTMSW